MIEIFYLPGLSVALLTTPDKVLFYNPAGVILHIDTASTDLFRIELKPEGVLPSLVN